MLPLASASAVAEIDKDQFAGRLPCLQAVEPVEGEPGTVISNLNGHCADCECVSGQCNPGTLKVGLAPVFLDRVSAHMGSCCQRWEPADTQYQVFRPPKA